MEGFAASLASSDVGGDGVDDIVIGAPSNRSVYLVHGRPDRVYSLGGTQIRPATSLQGFGTAVGASVVTGDGRSRMIVDAYYVGAGTLMEYSATSLSAPVATTTMSMPDCFGTRIVAH